MTRLSRAARLLILLGGGAVLGVGGCALFLNTATFNGGGDNAGSIAGAILFGVGVLMLAIGVLYGILVLLMKIFKTEQPAPTSGAPTTPPPAVPPPPAGPAV